MCELAGVSRTGLYRFWPGPPEPDPDMALRDAIQRIALEFPSYGWRRMTAELQRRGWAINHKRVYRRMREDNLLCLRKRKFVVTTDSDHGLSVYPNLTREMILTGLDQLWVADLTYIRLELEFVYLAVILDAFSRRLIGWALDRTLEAALTLQALRMALARRRPVPGLVHHSDRGVQYASRDYTQLLQDHGIRISMSRKAHPWDNAACESFLKTLKYEEIVCYECGRLWLGRQQCFIKDEGWPLEVGLQERTSNRHKLRRLRAAVVSVDGKGGAQLRQVRIKEANESEPLMRCRNVCKRRQNRNPHLCSASKGWEKPADCPTGVRHEGGANLIQALMRNVGTCRPDAKGRSQADSFRKGRSTEAGHRGGGVHSRVEGSVMGLDRRGAVVRFGWAGNLKREDLRGQSKTVLYCEARSMGGVQAGEGKPGCSGSRRAVDCPVRRAFKQEPLSDLESDELGELLPATRAPGGHTEGRWADQAARDTDGFGPNRPDGGAAISGANLGAGVPQRLLWISTRALRTSSACSSPPALLAL